jgi:hypothetical protein
MLYTAIKSITYNTESAASASFDIIFTDLKNIYKVIAILFTVIALIVYATVIIPFMQKISINRWKLHYIVSYIRIDILQQNKLFLTYIDELEKNKSN